MRVLLGLANQARQNHRLCTTQPFLVPMFGSPGVHPTPFGVRRYLEEGACGVCVRERVEDGRATGRILSRMALG